MQVVEKLAEDIEKILKIRPTLQISAVRLLHKIREDLPAPITNTNSHEQQATIRQGLK
jgi:hypothetical protein